MAEKKAFSNEMCHLHKTEICEWRSTLTNDVRELCNEYFVPGFLWMKNQFEKKNNAKNGSVEKK